MIVMLGHIFLALIVYVLDMEEITDNLSDFDFDDIDASSESSIDSNDDENNASASHSDTEELVDEDLA